MHLDDLKILRRALDLSHMTGHFHAPHDCAGKEALPDSARPPMPALGAVGGVATAKCMPADYTFETTTFGDADSIYIIAGSKQSRPENVSRLHLFREVAELPNAFDRRAAEFLNVPEQRFGHALLFLIVKTELNGIV